MRHSFQRWLHCHFQNIKLHSIIPRIISQYQFSPDCILGAGIILHGIKNMTGHSHHDQQLSECWFFEYKTDAKIIRNGLEGRKSYTQPCQKKKTPALVVSTGKTNQLGQE